MFSDLMRALAAERPHTMAELAVELGTDPDRLRLALEHCQQMGYLERLLAACAVEACSGCSVASACNPSSATGSGAATGPTWWRLTESGRKVAKASGAVTQA